MRQVHDQLWIGHSGDVRNLRPILAQGIEALIDLAFPDPPLTIGREITYCRFPIDDGGGNPPWLIRAAIDTAASLIKSGTPTLIFCSAGMSRSPSIAAAALSLVRAQPADQYLKLIAATGPADVAPGLWAQIAQVLAELPDR